MEPDTRISKPRLDYWFQHVANFNAASYTKTYQDILNYKYPLRINLARAKSARMYARALRSQALNWYCKSLNYKPIIKDPIALFSTEWLAKQFDMDVLVMIRHPAAFCSSLKIKNWNFDFNHFLDQPMLMQKYLSQFEREIHNFASCDKDIIDQGILLWNCFHHVIDHYRSTHENWSFMKHENLSKHPLEEFKLLYKKFGLEFDNNSKDWILQSSGRHNPVEQIPGREFERDSMSNVFNWKKRLTSQEIDRIQIGTEDISLKFYRSSDW